MYSPDREKIFEDMDASDACDVASCALYVRPENNPRKELACMATSHSDCSRVNQIASEVNQFIADNDDVFMYIQPINE